MKSDPKERKLLGDQRAEEVMNIAMKGCRCNDRGIHCILHGRLGMLMKMYQEINREEEVD